jgi:starch-binding outer membrane protein, SusD/RagB family
MAAVLAAMLAGCSTERILEVKDPDVVTPASLQSKETLPALINGALGSFENAYQGNGSVNESSGQIGYSGLLADEFISSGTFPTRHEVDQRQIQTDNGSNLSQFNFLSRARAAADLAARRYASLDPDAADHALALALDGFATTMFGENYCSGVPFSTLTDAGDIEYGEPLTTQQIFESAVEKFDGALGVAGASEDYVNLAKIGKGRALLDLGRYQEAATAVAGVPSEFVYVIESSSNTFNETNGVYIFGENAKRLSLADNEGENGLDYLSANDPRVPYEHALNEDGTPIKGQDGVTPLIVQLKYPSRDADVPLATGVEARLIEAEAAMQSGSSTFLDLLNQARAQFTGLAPLTADDVPPNAVGKTDLLFRERGFGLWITAHRLGDLRRLVRQYGRGSETVFPTGNWFKGGPYGPDVNMPVPSDEENNPNFKGCIDRSA